MRIAAPEVLVRNFAVALATHVKEDVTIFHLEEPALSINDVDRHIEGLVESFSFRIGIGKTYSDSNFTSQIAETRLGTRLSILQRFRPASYRSKVVSCDLSRLHQRNSR